MTKTILIMAGGVGERFWPLSTPEHPKQVLSIFTNKPMIQETIERIIPLIPASNIFIATNKLQRDNIIKILPDFPIENFIIEPLFKDTAAAIGYGSIVIKKRFGEETVITVLASDHIIKNDELFRSYISQAQEEAFKNNTIVTFGIKPYKPETGYGYIQCDDTQIGNVNNVISFKEKPNIKTAIVYLENGKYLWNSGMFTFKISTIMNSFYKYAIKHYEVLKEIETGLFDITELFSKFEKISIDYAIMEKTKNVKVIPIDVGWNDVGNYLAFEEIFDKSDENIIIGDRIQVCDSQNNIIISDINTKLLGIDDLIIVYKDNNLLIINKQKHQEIKKLLK